MIKSKLQEPSYMIEPKGVVHFSIAVSDLEASRKFYTEILGLTLIQSTPASGMAFFRAGRDHVILARSDAPLKRDPKHTRRAHHASNVDSQQHDRAKASARALRGRKADPVPEEIIPRILVAAIRAPSAGNAQSWAFVVVRDAEQRRKLGMIYRKASDIASEVYKARGRPAHMSEEQYRRFMTSGAYLWDHMGETPVLLVPCLHDRPPPPRATLPPSLQAIYEGELAYERRIRAASIYPAVQNIILACRAFGLGTVITPNHILCHM